MRSLLNLMKENEGMKENTGFTIVRTSGDFFLFWMVGFNFGFSEGLGLYLF